MPGGIALGYGSKERCRFGPLRDTDPGLHACVDWTDARNALRPPNTGDVPEREPSAALADRQRHGFAVGPLGFRTQLKAALKRGIVEGGTGYRVGMGLQGIPAVAGNPKSCGEKGPPDLGSRLGL